MAEDKDNTIKNIERIRKEGGTEVMKASAGAGKTFSLAREYIRLLLSDIRLGENNVHRSILAVTFTNKATGEMKERIIKELKLLAYDEKSDMREDLLKQCNYSDKNQIQADAGKALYQILNDYSAFSVSTIDKFFQRALRSFAREIGQFTEYAVELDKPSLVDETVENVLDSLSEEDSKELLEWLSETVLANMDAGEGYHMESILHDFANKYLSQKYDTKRNRDGINEDIVFTEKNLRKIQSICYTAIDAYKNKLTDLCTNLTNVVKDVKGKGKNQEGAILSLQQYANGESTDFVDKKKWELPTWDKIIDDGANLVNKDFKAAISDDENRLISDAFSQVADFFSSITAKEYNTAILVRKQTAMFRAAAKLKEEFERLQTEKGVICIDNTATLLHSIISDDDVPFVYEKLGVRYKHLLLDEFQDTSSLQWENFLPLLRNSVANEKGYNLVVGDVKQSIYRWRDADWSILNGLGKDDDHLNIVLHPLKENWRSAKNIVEFNNGFYETVAGKMDVQLGTSDFVKSLYPKNEVEQINKQEFHTANKEDIPGSVEISFVTRKEATIIRQTVNAIKEVHEKRGFKYKEIAVLVRNNKLGSKVAEALVANNIDVVSSDSLLISSSPSVRKAVALLFKIDKSKDRINSFPAEGIDTKGITGRSLSELAENAIKKVVEADGKEQVNNSTPYIVAFLDLVREFEMKEGNSIHKFLNYWQEEGMGKCIASPQDSNAVTISTIHKSKGLDYPFVVFPLGVKGQFITGNSSFWEGMTFDNAGSSKFAELDPALYNVNISEKLSETHFAKGFEEEKKMLYIDDLNTWYVATTRASEALHIIAPKPSEDVINSVPGAGWPKFTHLPEILYLYAVKDGHFQAENVSDEEREAATKGDDKPFFEKYIFGKISCKAVKKKKEEKTPRPYTFLPDGVDLSGVRGKIRNSTDAEQFFKKQAGVEKGMKRIRGIVLHGIMEHINCPEDLPGAVRNAVLAGHLTEAEAVEVEKTLKAAIDAVSSRGWFPADARKIITERGIVNEQGEFFRPDRVVVTDSGVDIIDYKFGEEESTYTSQVQNYAQLYRKLGFKNVTPYLWYVEKGAAGVQKVD